MPKRRRNKFYWVEKVKKGGGTKLVGSAVYLKLADAIYVHLDKKSLKAKCLRLTLREDRS